MATWRIKKGVLPKWSLRPTIYKAGPVWITIWTNRTPTGPCRDPVGHPRNPMEPQIWNFESRN